MQNFLFRYQIKDKVLAVGVSGGADSLALVLMAKEQLAVFGYQIIALTVDHGLRPSAAKEAEYVAQIMQQHNIEHHILCWEGNKPLNGVEEAARQARYTLMKQWCDEHGVGCLLVAHHLIDQAETFLMRLQRGSGLQGLCAIREVSDWNGLKILRPLLHYHPEELKEYLNNKGIEWVEDESNQDKRYLRNRVRSFLPLLEKNTGVSVDKLAQAAANLQSAEDFIESQVEGLFATDIRCDGDEVFSFTYNSYLQWHNELKFRVLARLCKRQYIPRAQRVIKAIGRLNKLPFTGLTLGKKEILMAGGRVWFVPEGASKHKASREDWENFVECHPQYKGEKIPHKVRLALLKQEEKV